MLKKFNCKIWHLGRDVLNSTSQTCGSGWLRAKLRYGTAVLGQSLRPGTGGVVLFCFYSTGFLRCSFVNSLDSESAGQHILSVTSCQISYHRSTVKSILSPKVTYKYCHNFQSSLKSQGQMVIQQSCDHMCVCVCSFLPVYLPGIMICVNTSQIWHLYRCGMAVI